MTTATANPAASDTAFFGHPRGLFVCFATELWERFSFYGMKYLLLLYLTKYHLFSDANGLEVLGSYAALVYAMPVIGGLLAGTVLTLGVVPCVYRIFSRPAALRDPSRDLTGARPAVVAEEGTP